MSKKYNIYGIGNAIMDYEIQVQDDFFAENKVEKGLMTLVEEERQQALLNLVQNNIKKKQSGGSGANSIISAAQFGARNFYSCKVASDEDGTEYLAGLEEEHVDTNLSKDALPAGTTGKCLVIISPDAERTMNTYLGITSDFSSDELVDAAITGAEILFMEGYLVSSPKGLDAMKAAKSIARENGVKVSLSFSDPAMVKYFGDQMKTVVDGGIDLLFCNEEEAMLFTDTENVESAFEALKQYAREFVITRGKEGASIFDGKQRAEVQGFPVKAVDTTGAGDMFCGAFLYGVSQGLEPALSGKLASKAASAVVSQYGPRLQKDQIQAIKKEILG